MKLNLRKYIGIRVRQLRLQKEMSQQEFEEKADLPQKYGYKLERLEPNIKIDTFEKILSALDTDLEEFFNISLQENDPLMAELFNLLSDFTPNKRDRILKLIIPIIKEMIKS